MYILLLHVHLKVPAKIDLLGAILKPGNKIIVSKEIENTVQDTYIPYDHLIADDFW